MIYLERLYYLLKLVIFIIVGIVDTAITLLLVFTLIGPILYFLATGGGLGYFVDFFMTPATVAEDWLDV